jgi:hypothetical protein
MSQILVIGLDLSHIDHCAQPSDRFAPKKVHFGEKTHEITKMGGKLLSTRADMVFPVSCRHFT